MGCHLVDLWYNTRMENDTTTTALTLQHVDYLVDRIRKCERDKRRILLERRKAVTNQHVDYLVDRIRKCERDKRRYLLQINATKMTNKDNRS